MIGIAPEGCESLTGALEEGMKVAKGEFIAVFDADFIPHKHFLENTIHFFTAANIGMVQMRWSHLNRNFSLITNLQSIFLDGHFVIEHTARNRSGRFFNFNGTAGIWRKTAISAGGGWEHDTLTEDLDLSYRTQMKGWQFIYLPEHSVPAELPVDIVAFKAQQHRWAKGSIQTAKKLLPKIFRARLPIHVKVEAFFHLAANMAYLLMVPLSISILPVVIFRRALNWIKRRAIPPVATRPRVRDPISHDSKAASRTSAGVIGPAGAHNVAPLAFPKENCFI